MRVLIAGAAGAIARKLALRLAGEGHQVIGVDRRPWQDVPVTLPAIELPAIELFAVDIRKRAAEEVFRHSRPEVVVHMATVTSLVMPGVSVPLQINLGGTRAVFEHSRAYGGRRTVPAWGGTRSTGRARTRCSFTPGG